MSDVPKRGRGRPRKEGADEEILGATLELLRTHGFRDLTVDSVVERTGVAKTTIYRRWPSKAALVVAALATVDEHDPAALLQLLREPDGEIVEVLRAILLPHLDSAVDRDEAAREIGEVLSRFILRAAEQAEV